MKNSPNGFSATKQKAQSCQGAKSPSWSGPATLSLSRPPSPPGFPASGLSQFVEDATCVFAEAAPSVGNALLSSDVW